MKILSIDGGGIKGLYSAALLASLEERFNKQVADCFDLIAGTSTGGILALALAARMPAQEIVELYKAWGPKIFPQRAAIVNVLRNLILSKYAQTNLKRALQNVFEELTIRDIYRSDNPVALCIPSINAITGAPYVFKTPHDSRLVRDKECFLWQIALATSAAPIYLPLAQIDIPWSSASDLFVDGGLWANNPSVVALTEALSYGKASLQDIHLLSVGNIKSSTTFTSTTMRPKGILQWREKVVTLTLETQSFAINNQIKLLFRSLGIESQYIRLEEEMVSNTHNCLKKMDCATKANINDLEVYGRSKANYEGVKETIEGFFHERT